LEKRWPALALRAQRDGIIDYREYDRADLAWRRRESVLLDVLEKGLKAKCCLAALPGSTGDSRKELVERLLRYELPWVLGAEAAARGPDRLIEMWKAMKESQK